MGMVNCDSCGEVHDASDDCDDGILEAERHPHQTLSDALITDQDAKLAAALPCPFCGSPPRTTEGRTGNLRILCSNRECPGYPATNWGDFDAMVKNWNTRSYPEIPDGSST